MKRTIASEGGAVSLWRSGRRDKGGKANARRMTIGFVGSLRRDLGTAERVVRANLPMPLPVP